MAVALVAKNKRGSGETGTRTHICFLNVNKMQNNIIQRLHHLGIAELRDVTKLNTLQGSYINPETTLPNGQQQKILQDDKIYYGGQIEIEGSKKCYGVAVDESQIAIFRYGCGGSDSELVCWLKLD